ncbi:MAG: hypothetical protein ABJ251_19355 [Paracoccaceae bacterium]
MWDDWQFIKPGFLASVALRTRGVQAQAEWQWPPRVLWQMPDVPLDPLGVRFGSDTVAFSHMYDPRDLAIFSDAFGGIETSLKFGGGFNIWFSSTLPKWEIASLMAGPRVSRPTAIVPLQSDRGPEFLAKLIDNMSHDAPLDIAFFKTFAQMNHNWESGYAAPLLLTPASNYFKEMDATRLSNRIGELITSLPVIAEVAGITTIDLPNPLYQLDFPAGPVDIIALRDRLLDKFDRGALRFDQEAQTGTDIFTIDLAARDYRGGYGSVDEWEEDDPSIDYTIDFVEESAASDTDDEDPFLINDNWGDEASPPFSGNFINHDLVVPVPAAPESSPAAAPARAAVSTSGAAVQKPEEQVSPDEEAVRYTTVSIYPGYHFDNVQTKVLPLHDTARLQPGVDYSIELAIRAQYFGIQPGNTPRAARVKRKGRETVRVYAAVRCAVQGGPKFDNPLQAFDWAFDQDTQPVYLRFTMPTQVPAQMPPIMIRLYSEELQLLDTLEIRHDDVDMQIVRRIHWSDIGVMPAVIEGPPVTALALHVSAVPGGYHIDATFKTGGIDDVVISPGNHIAEQDVVQLLSYVREFLTDRALNLYGDQMQVGDFLYERDVLPPMMELGQRAWSALFGRKRGGQEGASETLGKWIARMQPPEGTVVRITASDDAQHFVFPWNLMIPPNSTEPDDLWGLRYEIELTQKRNDGRIFAQSEQAVINAVVDPNFRNFVDHDATLTGLFDKHGFVAWHKVNSGAAMEKALRDAPTSDLFYFFCHGSASAAGLALPEDILRNLTKRLDDPENPAPKDDWRRQIVKLVSAGSKEARIKTDEFTFSEWEISQAMHGFSPRRPIVFLNMCHSADLLPGRSSGITRVFLDGNAAAVLGTECPMNARFADAFAGQVLGHLTTGASIASAVRRARKYFHDNNNLLGFAYTLYGHGEATLVKNPAIYKKETENEH